MNPFLCWISITAGQQRATERRCAHAARMGYMNGLMPGKNPNERAHAHLFCSPVLRFYYDFGWGYGTQTRKNKLASGEWVMLDGVAGPKPEVDTAMLEAILRHQRINARHAA